MSGRGAVQVIQQARLMRELAAAQRERMRRSRLLMERQARLAARPRERRFGFVPVYDLAYRNPVEEKRPLRAVNNVGYTTASDSGNDPRYSTVSGVAAVTHPSRDRYKRMVGANIRRERERAGLSQTELGERCDPVKTQKQVSSWEVGDHLPQVETLEQIAHILDVPVHLLRSPHGDDPRVLL